MLAVDQTLQQCFPSTFIPRSAKAMQSTVDNTLDGVVETSARSSGSDLGPRSNFSTAGFSNVVSGFQIGNNSGSITFHHHTETTLFGSLVAHDQNEDSIHLTRMILSKKARLQTGRRVSKAITPTANSVLEPDNLRTNRQSEIALTMSLMWKLKVVRSSNVSYISRAASTF